MKFKNYGVLCLIGNPRSEYARYLATEAIFFVALITCLPVLATNLVSLLQFLHPGLEIQLPVFTIHLKPFTLETSFSWLGPYTALWAISAILGVTQRTWWQLIALLPGAVLIGAEWLEIWLIAPIFLHLIEFSCVVSAVVFFRYGHILSLSFACASLFFLGDPLVAYLMQSADDDTSRQTLFLLLFDEANVSIFDTSLALCLVAVCKFLKLLWLHNRTLIADLAHNRVFWPTNFKVLKLWWPLPLVFIVSTFLYDQIFGWSETAFVEYTINVAGTDYNFGELPTDTQTALIYLQKAEDIKLAKKFDALTARVKNDTDSFIQNSADQFRSDVEQALPGRAPGTHLRSCGPIIFNLGCHLGNLGKSLINDIYERARVKMLNRLDRRIAIEKARAGATTDSVRNVMIREVSIMRTELQSLWVWLLAQALLTMTFIGNLCLALSLLVLAKSFMVVFARVLYHRDLGVKAVLEPGGSVRTQGNCRVSKAGSLSYPARTNRLLYVTRQTKVSNCPVGLRVPRPTALLFARLASRRWQLNLLELRKREQQVQITVKEPGSIVEWSLRKNERVLFTLDSLVGFSSDTKIGRLVTLNLAALVFGRFVYCYADGPGLLLLNTNNTAIVSRSSQGTATRKALRSYNPGCFVAWNIRSRFSMDSNLTVNDVLRSGTMVRKSSGDHVLVDTEASGQMRGSSGVLRYVRTFLLPF